MPDEHFKIFGEDEREEKKEPIKEETSEGEYEFDLENCIIKDFNDEELIKDETGELIWTPLFNQVSEMSTIQNKIVEITEIIEDILWKPNKDLISGDYYESIIKQNIQVINLLFQISEEYKKLWSSGAVKLSHLNVRRMNLINELVRKESQDGKEEE